MRFFIPNLNAGRSALVLALTLCLIPELARGQFNGSAKAIEAELSGDSGPLADWYKARNYKPVWDGDSLQGLAEFLRSLDRHGLRADLFRLPEWEATWRNPPREPKGKAAVDISTTHLALFAIQSLAYGFANPEDVHPKWKPIPRAVSTYRFLDEGLKQPGHRFATYMEKLVAPTDPRYWDLIETLERYRQIEQYGGWKPIPGTAEPVGPGEPYSHLVLLRARLQAEGDLRTIDPKKKNRSKVLDAETAQALRSFQFRHGIAPDAVIGPQTLTELNKPASERINMLIINIDRLRWMPRDYEQAERLEANIAESVLRLQANRRTVTSMEIIVGKKGETQTPVFHGDVKYLIFRPYWNIPLSIAKNELVPEALQDPQYMAKNDYQIVAGYGDAPDRILPNTTANLQKVADGALRMRQGTGPGNALGLVKFIFPNENSVYLHDTPDHSLFKATDRDFSHGCVRVSRPDELADLLLRRNGGWNLPMVQAAMDDTSQPNRRVDFKTPIPVYLVYWTSTIMDDGRVRFDQDIYGHDIDMLEKFGLVERPAIFREVPAR
ncbi:MAG: L,D-transpeptidase family protein [Verrucomicrobiales bacterium]|nr:L,D-transpeptidase family protein [Verrucomicrobiales bacterium]